MVTVLSGRDARLLLEPDFNDWCQVMFDLNGRQVALGADTISVIVDRLARALLDELEGAAVGILEGVEVRWVLSLSERHSTLYAGDHNDRRLIFIQAEDGSLIGKLSLSAEDKRCWRDALDRIPEPRPRRDPRDPDQG